MNKKIYIKSILAIIFAGLISTSCTDWLTIEPEGALLKEDFWKTTEDVDAAVAAMYNSLQSSTVPNLLWGEVRADLHTIGPNFGTYQSIAESNISPSNGAVSWSHYYKTINLANTIMYYNKQVYGSDPTFTKELMDKIDGECKFVRSLNHFYLVRMWRDVPLMNTPTISDTSSIFIEKSPEQEVINFIINDLLEAKDLASDDVTMKGRPNKYAIMSLLADVYLWDEQYQLASDYCDSVTLGGYSLEPSERWFKLYYPGNSSAESIFEVQYNEAIDNERNAIYSDLIPISGIVQLIPDKEVLVELLESSDIRSCTPFNPNSPNPTLKYLLTDVNIGLLRTTSEEDANFIYYRYADILLIKAEALNELGQEDKVNELLAQTKERAGIEHKVVSGVENLRAEILDERAREFLSEGKRWFDILRFTKRDNYSTEYKNMVADILLAGVNIKQKAILEAYVYDSDGYYLPIPDEDILYNPNLVQNPFYDKY